MEAAPEKCQLCGHSLAGNQHGPDQNDFDYQESPETGEMEVVHAGTCTYCVECNPRLKELKNGHG